MRKLHDSANPPYPGKPYVHEPLANTCLKPSLILLLQGNPLKILYSYLGTSKKVNTDSVNGSEQHMPYPLCSLKDMNNFNDDYKAMSRFLYNLTINDSKLLI